MLAPATPAMPPATAPAGSYPGQGPVPPMPPPHPRPGRPRSRARRPHWPRRTVRLRLTLMYGAVFLLCGTALLAITYILTEHDVLTGPVMLSAHSAAGSAHAVPASPVTGSGASGTGPATGPSGSRTLTRFCSGTVSGSAARAPTPINCSYLSRVLAQQRSDSSASCSPTAGWRWASWPWPPSAWAG